MCTSVLAHSPWDLRFLSIILKILISLPGSPHLGSQGAGYWLVRQPVWWISLPHFRSLSLMLRSWDSMDHNLWVVREHYKSANSLHQIWFFSAYAIFGISDLQQRNLQSISFQRHWNYRRSSCEVSGTDLIELQYGHIKSSFPPWAWQDSRVIAKEDHTSGDWPSLCQYPEEKFLLCSQRSDTINTHSWRRHY